MPDLLAPGVLSAIFERLQAQTALRTPAALLEVGVLIEDRAIQLVAARTHPYRTHTPASRGGPPASVSGTLARSITHTTPTAGLLGWEMKVGTAAGMYPPYSRTPSSLYGLYLETTGAGKSGIRFPFLGPAFHAVALPGAHGVFQAVFGVGWGIG